MEISNISIGNWLNINSTDYDEFKSIIEYAFKNNINSFDTASSYNYGEESLGYAIKNIPREKIFLSTKYYNTTNKNYIEGVSPEYLNEYIEKSLDKISTNYLDIIFIHNYKDDMDIKNIMNCINEHYKKGNIRSWGVCRWPKESINKAIRISKEKNYIPPSYYQGVFNLFNLNKKQIDFISFLRKRNILYHGYSPLARGVLTNKYSKIIPKESRAYNSKNIKFMYDLEYNKINLVSSLGSLANVNKCTVTQLVLSYLLSYNLNTVITGVRSKEQLIELISCIDKTLNLKTKNIIKKKFDIYG